MNCCLVLVAATVFLSRFPISFQNTCANYFHPGPLDFGGGGQRSFFVVFVSVAVVGIDVVELQRRLLPLVLGYVDEMANLNVQKYAIFQMYLQFSEVKIFIELKLDPRFYLPSRSFGSDLIACA